ncbi:MAG: NAD(P)H-binding protein [Anaerolineae bacterium]|jgi:NADH dehydrogenase
MILVTSPTTFVGRAVIRRLAAENISTRCVLQPSRYEQQLPTEVTFAIASASFADVPALRSAMHGVTTVIHLARGEERLEERTLQDQPLETASLLKAAQEAGVTRLIYLSRLGATPASAYPLFRVKGESEVAIQQSGLDYTVFRSAVVYGANDAFTTRLVMLAKMCPLLLPIPDVGMARFQPLWVEDLAKCIVATVDRDDLIGRTVGLGGPEHYTLEQMIRRVLEAAGVRRYLLHFGMPLMRTGSDLLEPLLVRNPTPDWWLDLAAVGSATELGTVPKHFGFEPCRFAQCLGHLRRRRPWRRDFVRHVLGY